jgi:hypothetical protein
MQRTILFGILLAALFSLTALSAPLSAQSNQSGCLAHRPKYIEGIFEVKYDSGCTGHDEPELDPVSSLPGSAKELTWTVVLPTGGAFPVSATGPTFWFGGAVTDPKSIFGQSFVELQFYPDAIVSSCSQSGGFQVKFAPNTYSVCSPVWRLTSTGQKGVFHETAAFNAMLTDGTGPNNPLIMHAGDTVTVHWFTTPAQDGFHVTVTDLTTNGSGRIVLNSSSTGPLMPAFDTQAIGNALAWGSVNDTPNSFVWEIGHESVFTGAGAFCVPGQVGCDSYDAAAWAGTSPIQIKSVTFADGSQAKQFAAVSDLGGKAEVLASCSAYGGEFCIYPWYTLGKSGYHFGVDFPDTLKDFGQADQYQQTQLCGGPFGADSTYCDTVLK